MIYLDNASTTPLCLAAKTALGSSNFGNPSNFYSIGQHSAELLKECRETIAQWINCSPDEIYFTSGASESNAWALSQREIRFCSKREHHSIIDYPDCEGIQFSELSAISDHVENNGIVAWILVNNETGEDNSNLLHSEEWKNLKLLKHIDATQAIGHIKVDVKALNCDSLSFSAHKFGGPKGVGVLYIREGANYKPLIIGSQQRGMRGGTENVNGITAMALALDSACRDMWYTQKVSFEVKKVMVARFMARIPSDLWRINQGQKGVSNILSISFRNISAEAIVLAMQEKDIFIGMGSACNTGNLDPSRVLVDMGVPSDFINGTIRLSFSRNTKVKDAKTVADEISSFVIVNNGGNV